MAVQFDSGFLATWIAMIVMIFVIMVRALKGGLGEPHENHSASN